jgi:hypothetical protein
VATAEGEVVVEELVLLSESPGPLCVPVERIIPLAVFVSAGREVKSKDSQLWVPVVVVAIVSAVVVQLGLLSALNPVVDSVSVAVSNSDET